MEEREKNLEFASSFKHFASALIKEEQATRPSITASMNAILNVNLQFMLRTMLLGFLIIYASTNEVSNINILGCFPVWPRIQHPKQNESSAYLATNGAQFTLFHRMLAAWIKDIDRLVDSKNSQNTSKKDVESKSRAFICQKTMGRYSRQLSKETDGNDS